MGHKPKPKTQQALPPVEAVAPLLPLSQPTGATNPAAYRRRAGTALTSPTGLGNATGAYKTALGV